MVIPLILGVGAGLFALLADGEKKPSKDSSAAPKSFDDGLKEGREAAEKEHKARAADRRRIEKIAAKQAMLYSRSAPKAPIGEDDGGGE